MTLETVGTLSMWLVVVLRIPQVIRHRDQRALWAAVALLALLTTLYMDAVQSALAHLAGAYAVYLGTHVVSVLSGAAVLSFVLIANGYRRQLPVLYGIAGATVVVLVVIYVLANPHDPRPGHASELPLFYFLLVSAFSVLALTSCALICALSSRRLDHWMMRAGLVLLAVGWTLNALPWLLNLVWLSTGNPVWIEYFSEIDGISGLCIAAATAFPLLSEAYSRFQDLRAYLRLSALWRSLTGAVPDIVLNRSRQVAAPLRFRLYRRVIEIRDVMLILRSYVGPDDLRAARDHVERRAVAEPLVGAAVTACWLTVARQHRLAGRKPLPQDDNLLGSGGDDLDREIGFLLDVAHAYRHHATTLEGTS